MNIFEQGQALSVAPFYFKEIGDEIQGTYIGKREKGANGQYERDNFNNEIITYELQVPDGVKNVSFTVSKKINEDMKHVNFGQIIGFKYISRDKFFNKKTNKETEFKMIKVFADPKIVDKEWMTMHSDGTNDSGMGATNVATDDTNTKAKAVADFAALTSDVPFTSASSTPEQKLKAISDLAKSKLGVIDPMAIRDAVQEATGLAFIVVNYDRIITVLEGDF